MGPNHDCALEVYAAFLLVRYRGIEFSVKLCPEIIAVNRLS